MTHFGRRGIKCAVTIKCHFETGLSLSLLLLVVVVSNYNNKFRVSVYKCSVLHPVFPDKDDSSCVVI